MFDTPYIDDLESHEPLDTTDADLESLLEEELGE